MTSALAVGVTGLCSESIDASDILRASLTAMRQAVTGLAIAADSALFDGRDVPKGLAFPVPPKAVIKGDGRSLSIAAASVIAKVTRDRMMMPARHLPSALRNGPPYGLRLAGASRCDPDAWRRATRPPHELQLFPAENSESLT